MMMKMRTNVLLLLLLATTASSASTTTKKNVLGAVKKAADATPSDNAAASSSSTTTSAVKTVDKKMFYLYKNETDSPVLEFDGEAIDFRKSTKPHVVVFYSPFCGHCLQYKSKYITMAKEILAKRGANAVEFYGVSCLAHREICREYNIKAFPTVTHYRNAADTKGVNIHGRAMERLPDIIKFHDDEKPAVTETKKEDDKVEVVDIKSKTTTDAASKEKEQVTPLTVAEKETTTTTTTVKKTEDDKPKIEPSTTTKVDPSVPITTKVVATEVIPPKGAAQAKLAVKETPKYINALKKKIAAEKKKAAIEKRSILRKNKQKEAVNDKIAKEKEESKALTGNAEGATKIMLENKPGTEEFEERKKKIQATIDKMKLKAKATTAASEKRRAKKLAEAKKNQTDKEAPVPKKVEEKKVAPKVLDLTPGKLGTLPFKKVIPDARVVEKVPVVKRLVKMGYEEELILDASLSFMSGLKMGVFKTNDPLSPEKRLALKNWLELMSISLPPEWGLHDLIDDLLENFDFIAKRPDNLDKILLRHRMSRSTWSPSCAGKNARNGFNCGFWKLLHVSSVGLAEHRGGINLVDSGVRSVGTPIFSPITAADTLREYMKNFFICTECSNNFLATYDNCNKNRRCVRLTDEKDYATDADWKEYGKWLWEFHNDVNVRLLKERVSKSRSIIKRKAAEASEEDEIAVLWPSIEHCVLCYEDDGSWDEDAVFVYLENAYWPGHELHAPSRLLRFYEEDPETGMNIMLLIVALIILWRVSRSVSKANIRQAALYARMMIPKGQDAAKKRSV